MTLSASLVMTTKNRKDELRTALASAVAQSVPLDIVVIDDGSTDGTSEFVTREFPTVRLFTKTASGGLIARRNEGAALATGDIVFSIDDDAEFSTPYVVEQTLADFNHPRVGAVAIPYTEPEKSPAIHQRAETPDAVEVLPYYIGTAHALRRELFLSLGGYHADFIHQGEEGDYCLRMLAAGYVVRAGRADLINHYESPKRDFTRMHIYGRRNDVLFAWCNLPAHILPIHVAGTLFLSLRRAAKHSGWMKPQLKGAFLGFRDIPAFYSRRKPVPSAMYWLMRRLRKSPYLPLAEFESQLPAISSQS